MIGDTLTLTRVVWPRSGLTPKELMDLANTEVTLLPKLKPKLQAHMLKVCPAPLASLIHFMPSKIRFEYFKAPSGLWFFHIKGANGKIVAQSEGYKRVGSVFKTIGLIRRHAGSKHATVTLKAK